MKKLFILLSLWVVVLTAQAQNTIESIRKAYQSENEYIAMMCDSFPSEGIPAEYYHLHVAQNLPATGPHTEDIRMFYNEVEPKNEEEEMVIYKPHYLRFATTKYNYAAREFYEEYLFDEKGQVMFVYAINPDVGDELIPYELRMWFDGKRLLRFQAKKYAGQPDYIDIAFLRNATFKEEFSGTTIPEKYSRDTDHLLERAKGFLLMFKNIENCTYFSEEINY